MSQISGVAGDSFAVQQPKVSSGRAVLLLGLAVVLGTVLLHELDGAPSVISQATAPQQNPAITSAQATNPAPVSPPQVRTPSEVKVLVANGTTVNGAANKVAGRLQPIGYQLLKPGNVTSPSGSSVVQFAPGYQPEAQALATSLGIPASAVQPIPIPAPIADLQGANVMVIVGSELAGQQAQASSIAGQGQTVTGAQTQQQTANPALIGPLNADAVPNQNTNTNAQPPAQQSPVQQTPQR